MSVARSASLEAAHTVQLNSIVWVFFSHSRVYWLRSVRFCNIRSLRVYQKIRPVFVYLVEYSLFGSVQRVVARPRSAKSLRSEWERHIANLVSVVWCSVYGARCKLVHSDFFSTVFWFVHSVRVFCCCFVRLFINVSLGLREYLTHMSVCVCVTVPVCGVHDYFCVVHFVPYSLSYEEFSAHSTHTKKSFSSTTLALMPVCVCVLMLAYAVNILRPIFNHSPKQRNGMAQVKVLPLHRTCIRTVDSAFLKPILDRAKCISNRNFANHLRTSVQQNCPIFRRCCSLLLLLFVVVVRFSRWCCGFFSCGPFASWTLYDNFRTARYYLAYICPDPESSSKHRPNSEKKTHTQKQ